MKTNTWIWITLMLMTVSSFSVSETGRGTNAAIFILGAAALKAGMVGWQFMELRAAHIAWRFAFTLLLVGTLGLIGLLGRIAPG